MSFKAMPATPIEIIDALRRGGNVFIDDHNGGKETRKVTGVVLYSRPGDDKIRVCPYYESTFCLNPLYMGLDGKVHLSTISVGGVMYSGGVMNDTPENRVENFLDRHDAANKPKAEYVAL